MTTIFFALAFWSAAPAFHTYPTVTLTVTGEKGESAKGAEVWVLGTGHRSGPMSVKGFEGWAPRDNAIVGFEGTKKTILVPPSWPDGGVIRFATGQYAGIVEIAANEYHSRIDLYSPTGNSIDVALPDLMPADFSMPFRIATTALFAWSILLLSVRASKLATRLQYFVGFAAALTGVLVWLGTAKMSAAGPVELLIVSPDMATATEPRRATAYLGTRHEYAETLPLPIDNYANQQAYHVPNTTPTVSLQPTITPLAIFNPIDIYRSREKALECNHGRPLIAEFDPKAEVGVKISTETATAFELVAPKVSTTADNSSTPARRYLVCLPYQDGLLVAWSGAHLKYGGAWTAPVGAVQRIRLDAPDTPLFVLRMSSGSSSFTPLQHIGKNEYSYPAIPSPLTHADQARRFATSLLAALCVLLLLPIFEVCKLARRYCLQAAGSCLLIVGAWMVFTVSVGWPAFFGGIDAISPFSLHGVGGMDLWYGVGYPLFVSAMINLASPELSLLLKVTVVGLAVLWVALQALNVGAKGPQVCVYLVAILAFTGTTIVSATELRDATNAVALSGFGIYVFALLTKYRATDQQLPGWHYLLLAILGAMIVLLRIDNVVFIAPLLAGFAFGRHWRHSMRACLAIAAIWASITPIVVPYVMDNYDNWQHNARLYKQTALINPLVGMLRGGSLPPTEQVALSATLGKVLNVDYSIEHWTPSDIIYWHQTNKGPGTPEDLAELQRAFVVNAMRHPVEFATLRTATALNALGMDNTAAWMVRKYIDRPFFRLSYDDQFSGKDARLKDMAILAGYRAPVHLYPTLTQNVLSWYERLALGTPQVLLAFALLFCFRRVPATSLVAVAVLLRVAVFWLLQPASVFMYLAELQILGSLLPLMAWTEWHQRSLISSNTRSLASPASGGERSAIAASVSAQSIARPNT
ncbi:hypothetical protein [Achromobacter sp. Marseille-Q4954]|uniref:hypothetical protein n=1 Tax=Achromobacter sp. Marseille-Q4954 TaxID=2942203 RepID=UPI0020747E9D|nr:hypothetical protein [Achromobacter sp. Marseille-Q4954]